MGVPEKGITLALKDKTAVHANLLDCGDCIQDIYVYDVWNMDEQDIANDTNSKVYNGAPSRWRTSSTQTSLKRTTDFRSRQLTAFRTLER